MLCVNLQSLPQFCVGITLQFNSHSVKTEKQLRPQSIGRGRACKAVEFTTFGLSLHQAADVGFSARKMVCSTSAFGRLSPVSSLCPCRPKAGRVGRVIKRERRSI